MKKFLYPNLSNPIFLSYEEALNTELPVKQIENEVIFDEVPRDLENTIFSNVTFQQFHLENGMDLIFENCDLSNCDFTRVNLSCVVFRNCKLIGTKWMDATLYQVYFETCIGTYSNFSGSSLKEVKFTNSNFEESSMNLCSWTNVILEHVKLNETEFLDTPLKGIDFRTSDIFHIKVKESDLVGAVVTPLQAVELSKLLGLIIQE